MPGSMGRPSVVITLTLGEAVSLPVKYGPRIRRLLGWVERRRQGYHRGATRRVSFNLTGTDAFSLAGELLSQYPAPGDDDTFIDLIVEGVDLPEWMTHRRLEGCICETYGDLRADLALHLAQLTEVAP